MLVLFEGINNGQVVACKLVQYDNRNNAVIKDELITFQYKNKYNEVHAYEAAWVENGSPTWEYRKLNKLT
ncbi:hypothetical protein A9498_02925 [Bacillus thuringiensis serovar coreanensis]|nr:hypothetical protein A9498_02925 [Bacillus thuringiensis serovar coreanensis]